MMKKKLLLTLMIAILLQMSFASPAQADLGRIFSGATKVVGSVFEIPKAMIEDSTKIIFPAGILTGAVRGSLNTVMGVLGGAVDMASGAAPYAKYLLLL